MANDPYPTPRPTGYASATANQFPLGLWALWTLAVVAAATWVAWPSLLGAEPLDMPRLVITSALVGVAGLLALTVFEIRLAPWHFLE